MSAPNQYPIAAAITRYRMAHPLGMGGQGMTAETAWEYADHVADQVIALERRIQSLVDELNNAFDPKNL
jgi:hypothetical protein